MLRLLRSVMLLAGMILGVVIIIGIFVLGALGEHPANQRPKRPRQPTEEKQIEAHRKRISEEWEQVINVKPPRSVAIQQALSEGLLAPSLKQLRRVGWQLGLMPSAILSKLDV